MLKIYTLMIDIENNNIALNQFDNFVIIHLKLSKIFHDSALYKFE